MQNTRGFRSTSKPRPDRKIELLTAIAPPGFGTDRWREHIHMIHPGGPATRPRIMTTDRGLIELDQRSGKVLVWGKRGIATELARALADAGNWQVEHLDGFVEVARRDPHGARSPASRLPASRTSPASRALWWRERGYQALATPDGVWVDAGSTRIRDLGDRLELHGPVSDESILAAVTKAKEEWEGGLEIDGQWAQRDLDRIWVECQRQGVVAENCKPSRQAIESWEREKAATVRRDETLSLLRARVKEAELLREAASGDPEVLNRLSPELRAFVTSYLDDTQRTELGRMSTDAIVTELSRFRSLGYEETESAKRNGEPDPGLQRAVPKPSGPAPELSPRSA